MQQFLDRINPVWKPHPGQLEFLKNPAKIKVLACGRRWGKTDACAIQILASLFKDSPAKHVIIAPTLDQANILFDRTLELLCQLTEGQETKPKVKRTPYPRFDFRNHRVVARSGHLGRSLRGNEATDIVIDEAAFVPEELVAEVAMPMLATTNGSLTLISTPRGMNHFWKFYRMGQDESEGPISIWSRRAPTAESPYVTSAFLEIQKELISDRAFRVEYEAEFLDSAGRVFGTEAIDRCLVPQFVNIPTQPFYIGVDWARYSDYTAIAVVSGIRKQAMLVHIERFQGSSWKDQIARVAGIANSYPEAHLICDGTGTGDALVEQLLESLNGPTLKGEVFTAPYKATLIDRLASTLDNGWIQMLPQPDLIRELQHFEVKTTDSGHQKLGAMSGFHDDLVIALALAVKQLPSHSTPPIRVGKPRGFAKPRRAIPGIRFGG